MNRNTVIVDGTKSGPPCNHITADQNFGPKVKGSAAGLNGIMVWKADNVWVQNMTACNFLGGSGQAGNEFWWNGGADSGGATKVSIGGWGYLGTYLTATTTLQRSERDQGRSQKAEVSAAEYGIFSSNWSGGTWDHTYASNFNDSGYYIGACGQRCNQTVNHAWASGTRSATRGRTPAGSSSSRTRSSTTTRTASTPTARRATTRRRRTARARRASSPRSRAPWAAGCSSTTSSMTTTIPTSPRRDSPAAGPSGPACRSREGASTA